MIALAIVVGGFIPETFVVSARTSVPKVAQIFAAIDAVNFVESPEEVDVRKSGSDESDELDMSAKTRIVNGGGVPTVPFFSQFTDISDPQWRKVGCGIASLAMIIEYYEPTQVEVDELLQEGITADAFLSDAGWTHAGLIGLSKRYGLTGETHDLRDSSMDAAFTTLQEELEEGPVMASVHYTFDPQNPIPHLVVVNGVSNGKVYYNDPSEVSGGNTISIAKFQSAWKKRYIDIRPIS